MLHFLVQRRVAHYSSRVSNVPAHLVQAHDRSYDAPFLDVRDRADVREQRSFRPLVDDLGESETKRRRDVFIRGDREAFLELLLPGEKRELLRALARFQERPVKLRRGRVLLLEHERGEDGDGFFWWEVA